MDDFCMDYEINEPPVMILQQKNATTINDLRTEDLARIFTFLSENEKRTVMTVNKRWLSVVNSEFPAASCLILTKDMNYSRNGELFNTFLDRITMEMRQFTHVKIKSFPETLEEFLTMIRFLDFVKEDVTNMTIESLLTLNDAAFENILNELLYTKMPKLKCLVVLDEVLLGNMVMPKKLQSIDVLNGLQLHLYPYCQHLKIKNFSLQSSHFSVLCEHMPRIRNLFILHGTGNVTISIDSLLDQNKPSIKDLTNLHELVFETSSREAPSDDAKWPRLSNLRILRLTGIGFSLMSEEMVTELADNCPLIEQFKLDVQGGLISVLCLLPLIYGLYLTTLEIPGEVDYYICRNSILVANVMNHCHDLQSICIKENCGFSLEHELKLFQKLPTLQTVTSIITLKDLSTITRVMTRDDLHNLKEYLKRNIIYYKDMQDTLDFLLNHVISMEQVIHLYEMYLEEYREVDDYDGVRKLYVILSGYLNLPQEEICKIICMIQKFISD
ncbi:uncharacterized protein LOC134836924 [Culicoides brevitarsis]|uniref:uncharacterized protein LOC134836924 n=1 Tax=Culicoides brevitarsis TaxID=469753 RepID=UPI00307B9B4F